MIYHKISIPKMDKHKSFVYHVGEPYDLLKDLGPVEDLMKDDHPEFVKDKDDDFYGRPWSKTKELIEFGDNSKADKVQKALEAFENFHDRIETPAYERVNDVQGSHVNIGSYLAGSPTNMMYKKKVDREVNPVNIMIDITVSGGTSQEEIENRGIAAIVIALEVSKVRPVNLRIVSGMNNCDTNVAFICDLGSSPHDMARSGFILTGSEMLRRVFFSITCYISKKETGEKSAYIDWWDKKYSNSAKFVRALAKEMFPDEDLFVVEGSIHSMTEGDRSSVESTLKWVTEKIESLTSVQISDEDPLD